jgi:lysozyme
MEHVNGIDVSDWQGAVDWAAVNAAGYSFAFAKASEGAGWTGKTFAQNRSGIARAGILRGAYHMFTFDANPIDQASLFLSTAQPSGGDLPPVVDLERPTKLGPRDNVAAIRRFLDLIEARTHIPTIVYVGYYYWRDVLGSTDAFADHPLWLANYTDEPQPTVVPSVWKTVTFWQYSSKGSVGGIKGLVDLDRYLGTPAQLEALRLK